MTEYPELDELRAKLDTLRPLDNEKIRAVREKFRLEWTYHSNAIEGNPLTLSETSFFIREGLTSKGRPLSAYLEAKNHIEALDYLESIVAEKTPLTEHLVRQYHAMLFHKIDRISIGTGGERREMTILGGQYKQENNHVIRLDGKIREFTDWLQVPEEMERFFTWHKENETLLHPVELASQLHHRFVSIHPFIDGNGRVSRLLLNTILLQRGYTPAIIPVEDKQQYLEALQYADDGNYEPLYRLVENQLSKTLRLMLDVVEGREAFDFDDLARMLSNMAKMAQEIRQDLGPATEAPEKRSLRTATQVMNEVKSLLKQHQAQAQTKAAGLSVNIIEKAGIQQQTPIYRELRSKIGQSITQPIQLSVSGGNRTVPNLTMFFFAVSGRYQVALAAYSTLGQFNQQNEEAVGVSDLQTNIEGSIYFEDWDKKTLHDFVLDYLKHMYQKCEQEIERRKSLIAEEEANLAQYRRR